MSCVSSPLNGSGANTEKGRLHRELKACDRPVTQPFRGGICCRPTESVQAPITPSSSSYTQSLMTCGVSANGGMSQARVLQLLAQKRTITQYETESARIAAVEQNTVNCSVNPLDPNSRFALFAPPIVLLQCPPLPPPPAPPAKACPLTKGQKMLYP
jgi:hypothetical protein